jgi:hypothetical protein
MAARNRKKNAAIPMLIAESVDVAADKIREAIRAARKIKKASNEDITDALGWTDTRKLTNALMRSYRLRAAIARQLLEALYEMKPRDQEAQRILLSVKDYLRVTESPQLLPPRPAVAVIPADGVRRVAVFFTELIAKHIAIGEKRRQKLVRAVTKDLSEARKPLARNAMEYCIARQTFETDAIRQVFSLFGYAEIFTQESSRK